jgi:hypothetical protein
VLGWYIYCTRSTSHDNGIKNLLVTIKIVVPMTYWCLVGRPKVEESLDTRVFFNWINTISNLVDTMVDFNLDLKEFCMVYRPTWYGKQKYIQKGN